MINAITHTEQHKTGKPYFILLHFGAWALFFLALNAVFHLRLIASGEDSHGQWTNYSLDIQVYKSLAYGGIFKIIFFYVNSLVLLKRFSKSHNVGKYIMQLLLLLVCCLGTEYAVRYYFNHTVDNEKYKYAVQYLTKMNIVFYTLILGFSFINFFWRQWAISEKIKHSLIEEQLSNELNLLKFQINPHFLFNTLNNLFSIAQDHNDVELTNGIYTLAGLMRYIIYESNARQVKLQKEIDYIEDYMDIYKLKFEKEDNIQVSLKIEGEPGNKFISPMLLIPFVENAFKHGINIKKDSSINIFMKISDQKLFFCVCNTNHSYINKSEDNNSGIGLPNVKKRLELLFGSAYTLEIDPSDPYYITNLTLPLTQAV
jgi:two-component system, LytTR family, sensor kinase